MIIQYILVAGAFVFIILILLYLCGRGLEECVYYEQVRETIEERT